jgi:hypothetical protein
VEKSIPGVTQRGVGVATSVLFALSVIPLGLGWLLISEYQLSYLTGDEDGRSFLAAFVLAALAPVVYCVSGGLTLSGSVYAGAWALGFAIVQALLGLFFGRATVPWLALAQIFPAVYLARPTFRVREQARLERTKRAREEADRTWLEREDWKDARASLDLAADPRRLMAGRRAIGWAGAGFIVAHLLTMAVELGAFGDDHASVEALDFRRRRGLYAMLKWMGALGSDSLGDTIQIQRLLFLLAWIGLVAATLNRHAWARRALMGFGFSLAFFLVFGSLRDGARAPSVTFIAGCLDLVGALVLWRSLAVRRFFAEPHQTRETASN